MRNSKLRLCLLLVLRLRMRLAILSLCPFQKIRWKKMFWCTYNWLSTSKVLLNHHYILRIYLIVIHFIAIDWSSYLTSHQPFKSCKPCITVERSLLLFMSNGACSHSQGPSICRAYPFPYTSFYLWFCFHWLACWIGVSTATDEFMPTSLHTLHDDEACGGE